MTTLEFSCKFIAKEIMKILEQRPFISNIDIYHALKHSFPNMDDSKIYDCLDTIRTALEYQASIVHDC